MYEDFDSVSEEKIFSAYADQEKILCPYCQGMGKLSFDSEEEMIDCHLCQGKRWVSHQHYPKLLSLNTFPENFALWTT
ncbi:hypothetical protein [Gloeothece verrucosa]|uniref:Uncharacterized protein n=1 Tax=Gloeothece verrucosa (strain PCC 7822) TaxID=497965 RepID=E0UDK6_GLOV7|nr:hypothetical protein [Gloeothece verrucosa]ADN15319.1 hypothetical protein Cyan7822_3369 [Gloeothece verrucosa PCC 7822]